MAAKFPHELEVFHTSYAKHLLSIPQQWFSLHGNCVTSRFCAHNVPRCGRYQQHQHRAVRFCSKIRLTGNVICRLPKGERVDKSFNIGAIFLWYKFRHAICMTTTVPFERLIGTVTDCRTNSKGGSRQFSQNVYWNMSTTSESSVNIFFQQVDFTLLQRWDGGM